MSTKRILALILTLVMCFTVIAPSTIAFAEGEEQQTIENVNEIVDGNPNGQNQEGENLDLQKNNEGQQSDNQQTTNVSGEPGTGNPLDNNGIGGTTEIIGEGQNAQGGMPGPGIDPPIPVTCTTHNWDMENPVWSENITGDWAGYTTNVTFTCSTCGATETIVANSNPYVEEMDVNCAEQAYKRGYFVVTFNGQELSKELTWDVKPIDPLEHPFNLEHIAAAPATCTEPGNNECWYCGVCEKYFSDEEGTTEITDEQRIISAAGHDLVFGHCQNCDYYEEDEPGVWGNFRIDYDPNYEDASSSFTDFPEADFDGNIEIEPCMYDRPGYIFAGWATASNGDVVYNAGDTVDENDFDSYDENLVPTLVLYAVWVEAAAKVGEDAYYATLAEAVEAAQDGDTVIVLKDITISSTITVNKIITLDATGKTVTIDMTGGTRGIRVNGGSLTIEGGTFTGINGSTGNNGSLIDLAGGSLTVNAGSFTNANTCIGVTDGTANINYATMKALDGGTCILAIGSGAVVNIRGLRFTCEAEDEDGPGCAWAQKGARINIYSGTYNANLLGEATIAGETTGANYCLYDYRDAPAPWGPRGYITVYGGTFLAFNPADNYNHDSFLADGYVAIEDNNTWTVSKIPAAQVEGGEGFDSVEEAIAEVANNTPITVNEATTIAGEEVAAGSTVTTTSGTASNAGSGDAATTVTPKTVTIAKEGEQDKAVNVYVVAQGENSSVVTDAVDSSIKNENVEANDLVKVADVLATQVATNNAIDADKVTEIEISVKAETKGDAQGNAITYEVDPYATIKQTGAAAREVKLTNNDLADDAVFTFHLDVTAITAAVGDKVAATHKSGSTVYGTEIYEAQGNENARYIEITTDRFSEWDLTAVGQDNKVAEFTPAGAYVNSYATLSAAVSGMTSGNTLVMVENETVSSSISLSKALTLDLNGKTITSNGTLFNSFNSNTDLTITDSGVYGEIVVNNADKAIYLSSGKLTLAGGDLTVSYPDKAATAIQVASGAQFIMTDGSITIPETSGKDGWTSSTNSYGVNNSGSTNISGGSITVEAKGPNYAVSSSGTLTVSGGRIEASNANNIFKAPYTIYVTGGTASITGGTIVIGDLDPYGWSDAHLVYGNATVSGGTYIGNSFDISGVRDKLATGYTLKDNGDNSYTVVKAVAQIGQTKYTSLADAVAAVPTDGTATTITMIADEALTSGLTIAAGKNIVLELAGHTVSGIMGGAGTTALITNRGTLTVQDNTDTSANGGGTGKLTNVATNPDTGDVPGYASNLITNNGTFILASGLLESKTNAWAAYAVDNQTNGGLYTPVFTMNGGRLYSQYTDAVRLFLNSDSKLNKVVINGGVLDSDKESGRVVVMQDSNAKANKGELIINGGTINGAVSAWSNPAVNVYEFSAAQYAEVKIEINQLSRGCIKELDFSTYMNDLELRPTALVVTGGYYKVDPTEYVAAGYEVITLDNTATDDDLAAYSAGFTYKVVEQRNVASVTIGGTTTNHTTLADAVAAANAAESSATITLLKNYDMETNEPGYGWTTLSHSARENFLDIGNNVTFDLNGKVLSNIFNNTFRIVGDNVTVQNGTMQVGTYTNGTTCSYIMYVKGASNFVVNDLTTYGGINVSASTAEINNLSFSGTTFYAVCSQSGAEVTLNGGTYNKAVPGAANYLFWVENGSTMNITGGTYIKGSANFRTGVNPVITGGVFDFDPTNFGVAEGYEAVSINDPAGYYQVGIISTADVAPAAEPAEGYDATYTATKTVTSTDGENTTLASNNAVIVNVKTSVDNTLPAYGTDTTIGKITTDAKSAIVAEAIGLDNTGATTYEVNIAVVGKVETAVDQTAEIPTITYEVHPIATVKAGDTEIGSFPLTNDQIDGSFIVRLAVPDEIYIEAATINEKKYVDVSHISEENSSTEKQRCEILGELNGYYVEITVTHFSQFLLEPATVEATPNASHTFTLDLQDSTDIILFLYGLADGTNASQYKVTSTYRNSYGTDTTIEKKLTDEGVAVEEAGFDGWYMIRVASFAAFQMADVANVTLYYTNDATAETPVYSEVESYTYSIQTYCNNRIQKSQDEGVRELCKAVLDYGRAAQYQFNYNTDSMVSGSYYHDVAGTVIDSSFNQKNAPVTSMFSSVVRTLSLDSKTEVAFFFTLPSGNSIDEYTFSSSSKNYTATNAGSGYYSVVIDGISAPNLDETVTLTCEYGGDSIDLTYSPLSFAYAKQDSGTEALQMVCKALFQYYYYADEYFNKD